MGETNIITCRVTLESAIAAGVSLEGAMTAKATLGVPVEVPVPPTLAPLEVTANGTYTPSEGIDGFSNVSVTVPEPQHPIETWVFTLDNDSTVTKVVILDD